MVLLARPGCFPESTKIVGYPLVTELPSAQSRPDCPGPERDAVTVRMLVQGNPEGLRRLLVDHGGKVRWNLRHEFDKVLDATEIDDAISQATHRVWRAAGRYDADKGSLRAWFFCIARNCALRLIEVKGRGDLRFVPDLDMLATGAHREPDALDDSRAQVIDALYRCIDELPGQQRAVILADLAAGGVADTERLVAELRTTANSVYVSRARARKALREAMHARGHRFGSDDDNATEVHS